MDIRYMLVAILTLSIASAAPSASLSASMENIICHSDFTAGVLTSVMDNTGGYSELQSNVDLIKDDVKQLSIYAEAGNVDSFRTYMETYSDHLRAAKMAVKNIAKDEVPKDQLKAIHEDYKNLSAHFTECARKSSEDVGKSKLDQYEKILNTAKMRVASLEAKGVKTDDLKLLIEQAYSEIIDPLREAVNNAQNHEELRRAFASYCLLDGCPNGVNFHFIEKFNHVKQGELIDSIEARAEAAGYERNLTEMRQKSVTWIDHIKANESYRIHYQKRLEAAKQMEERSKELKELMRKVRSRQ